MAKQDIRVYGDPVLRKKAREVKKFDRQLQRLVKSMFSTMYGAKGVGLAAPQIGLSHRIIVIDTGEKGEKVEIINPEIVACSEESTCKMTEGCLSVPEAEGEIVRPECVKVIGLSSEGEEVSYEAEGLLARVIQHEVDHLNGILFVDHLEGMERELLQSTLERIARSWDSR